MEFLEIAYENNKIKLLDEINENDTKISEYLNKVIFEENIKYNNYIIGDIVFVHKYKYNTGRIGLNHIFLIVDMYKEKHNFLYFGMLISSKTEKLKYQYNKFIKKDDKNNLRKDSIIKTDVIYKIFTENILLKIGNIDKTKVDIYKNYLINND